MVRIEGLRLRAGGAVGDVQVRVDRAGGAVVRPHLGVHGDVVQRVAGCRIRGSLRAGGERERR